MPAAGTSLRSFVRVALAAALMNGAWARGDAPAGSEEVRFSLVHVNDSHGRTQGGTDASGKAYGGYARLATYVAQVRAAKDADRVLLIHAGDEFSKPDELTVATKGKANISLFNHLKFDMWVPGNGEYYGGLDVLRTRMGEARCRVLCANVTDQDGKLLAQPYIIEEVKGAKIAFLGLGYIHAPQVKQSKLTLADPAEVCRKLLPELRKQADVVVAVSHIGLNADVKLAEKVSGLDIIIGGHSHNVLPAGRSVKDPDGKTVLICQAGEFLHYAGRVDVRLTRSGGKWSVAETKATLTALDETIKLDPTVTAIIAREAAATQPGPATEPVGSK